MENGPLTIDLSESQKNLSKLIEINKDGQISKKVNPTTIVGYGVNLDNIKKEINIAIDDADRSGHFGVFGTTRVGKTRLIETIVEQDIKKGYNVAIFDPKGDLDLMNRVIQAAAESGRLYDLMLLTTVFPELSIKLDPLSHYYMEDELTDHVISGIKAKEDYFIAIAQEVTQAIIAGLILQAKSRNEKPDISFYDVKNRSDYINLKKFGEAISMLRGSDEICQGISQILTSPMDFFSKVSSSLRTTLSALTTGSTGQVLGKCHQNEFVKRFEEGKGVILFCNTGSMLARRTAHLVGRVLISMIQSMVGRFFVSGRKLTPPLCIHIDEGHNMLYRGIQELFSKGGGANCWVHFYTQSVAQMTEEVGKDAARSILDNINTWIYMLVNHPETAQYVEDSSPEVKVYSPILSFGGGITIKEVKERRIKAFKVMELDKREFYMKTYGKLFKGKTADVHSSCVSVVLPAVKG